MWNKILSFVAPNYNAYWSAAGTTGKGKLEVYSNFAYYCSNSYSAQLLASGFPPKSRWCSFTPSASMVRKSLEYFERDTSDESIWEEEKASLARGLRKISDRAFDLIFDSNFDEIAPVWLKLFCLTDAFIRVAKDNYRGHGVSFFVPPLGSYAYDIDGFGNIWGIFYSSTTTVGNARLQWKLQGIPGNFSETSPVRLIECYVREGGRWKFVVLMTPGSDGEGAFIVTKPVYRDFCPWAILRGIAPNNEIWSRGILVNCLSDILKENIESYLSILNRELATNIMFMYRDDGSFNPKTFRSAPGSLIRVKSTGGPNGPSLLPINIPYNQQLHQSSRSEDRSDISRNLLGDPMLNNDRNTYQSAREWMDRQRFDQIRYGVNYGAINRAARSLLLAVTELLLVDEGMMAFPPELEAFRRGGLKELGSLSVQLESPLSRMYSQQEVEALTAMLQISSAISPELLQTVVNVDKIPSWLGEKMGIDPRLFKTDDQRTEEAARALQVTANMSQSVLPRQPQMV
jgi:hypothetical protein